MSTMNSIRDTFFEECEDLLAALADGFGLMQTGTHDPETVNAVFRAVHSIKGGAGAFIWRIWWPLHIGLKRCWMGYAAAS